MKSQEIQKNLNRKCLRDYFGNISINIAALRHKRIKDIKQMHEEICGDNHPYIKREEAK